ncbi:MAG: carbon storage regulator [Holosporales bacterium]
MLYIARKPGEAVIINGGIKVTVTEVRGRTAKLAFEFPPHTSVLREELYARIMDENRNAAASLDLLQEELQ